MLRLRNSDSSTFDYKNVIYIGGFGGVGFATCTALVKQGINHLIIMDVKHDAEKMDYLRLLDEEVLISYLKIDFTEPETVEKAFNAVKDEMAQIDVLINGSGIMNEKEIRLTVDINLLGPIYSTFAALRLMSKANGGAGGIIVNISSIVGLDAYSGYAVYTATKHGLNGFTKALSDPFYYKMTGVKFVTICPSTTETDMIESLKAKPLSTFDKLPPPPTYLQSSQTAEQCARNILRVLNSCSNGTTWITYANKFKEWRHQNLNDFLK